NIHSTNAHQTSLNGTSDGYIIKFNPAGGRAWATYYGGVDYDEIRDAVCDYNGNLIVVGTTSSVGGSGLSTSSSHQVSNGGNGLNNTKIWDGFIAKFNSAGTRQWGTYYGGDQSEDLVG